MLRMIKLFTNSETTVTFPLLAQHVDEAVNSQLKERFQEKMTRLQKGEKKVFEDMFAYACPKFISPIPPDYDSLPENYNKVGE